MNIQISVVIWTVICFIALYFILKYLLFKPVLSVIDERKAKAEAVRKKREDAELKKEEALNHANEEREIKIAQMIEDSKAQNEKIRLEGKQKLDEAKEKRLERVENFTKALAEEYPQDSQKIKAGIPEISDAFFETLFADR